MPSKSETKIEDLLASRKKKFPYITSSVIFGILLLISAFYFDLFSLFDSSEKETKTEKEIVVAEMGNMANTLTSSGTAKAGAQSNLYSDSTGEVNEVKFSAGDEVKKDEVIVTFNKDTATRNLEISKSNLNQAQITLNELLNSPTDSEKLNASQSKINAEQQLESSKQQLKNAEITLDKLIAPDLSQINSAEASVVSAEASVVSAEASVVSAEASVVSAKSSIVSAQNAIDNAYVELLNSQKSYCDTLLTASPFADEKAPVCSTTDLPLSESNRSRLLDDIKSENDPTTARITTTKALLLANSTYTNSLSSLKNANSNLQTSESSVLTSESSVLTANSNLQTAQTTLNLLLNPSERDILQTQLSIDTAKISVLSSQASLDSAVQSEKDILSGASEFQIDKQKQAVYSAELSVQENQEVLDSLEVKSPRDGVIGSINVSVGDKVSANTLLGVISDITSISVDLAISESDVEGIQEGLYGIALFDSLPDQSYVVKISNVSIIPNINQGIVSYPVEAEILKTRDIAAALPELARYASGISGSSELASFISPQNNSSRPSRMDPSNLDLECIREQLGDDFDINNISPETIQKVMKSGCMPESTSGGLGSNSMLSVIEQFAPSKMPTAGMGANVILLKDLKEDLIMIPSKSIIRKGKESYVKKVQGEEEIEVKIVTGDSDGIRTSVTEGVNAGDLIIIEYQVSADKPAESLIDDNKGSERPPRPPGGGGFRGNAGK